MSKVNRGKQFEEQIRQAFERVPDTSIDRLIDPQNGFAGVRNICDFIVYNYPIQYYIECKSCYGNTLPFSNITDNQWTGLLKKSWIKGVVSGYIIWFIDHDLTIFVTAEDMNTHELTHKSVNVKDLDKLPHIVIPGKKKRILFDYDMTTLLKGENYEQTNYGTDNSCN